MSKRHSLGRGHSKHMFRRGAVRVHPKNVNTLSGPGGPMRGGIRL